MNCQDCLNLCLIQVTDDTEFGFDSGSQISVDRHGNIKGLRSKHTGGIKESIQQVFGWYEGHAGQNLWPTDRASGAYIFRPATQKPQYWTYNLSTPDDRYHELVCWRRLRMACLFANAQ